MDNGIQDKFEKMGARVKVGRAPDFARPRVRGIGQAGDQPIRIDIRHDEAGEYFDLRHGRDVEVRVVDVRPSDRHLLLMATQPAAKGVEAKSRFLCGHDERSWFVAAVPEHAHASNVQAAKDALKPAVVWNAIRALGVPMKDRDRRRTAAFVRQGEWFFVPRPRMNVLPKDVLKNEPIRRGRGKPHLCQFIFRTGGQPVYVNAKYPNGLAPAEYMALPQEERRPSRWQFMVRDARVFAKGSVRHPDHKTIWLTCWHQVVMNTETESRAMENVAFLD